MSINNDHAARIRLILIIAAVVFILLLLIHHWFSVKTNGRGVSDKAVLVVLAAATTSNVPVYLTALGTVTPVTSVTVRSQVNGVLLRVLFTEGQQVKTGDLLAEIDPRPFEAQVKQFEGQLARDQALLVNARLDLQRYQTSIGSGAVTKQLLDTQTWLVKQDEGTVKADEGQLKNAQVNLTYTKIVSPMNGRVGLRLTDPGNFVQTSDLTGIVIVNGVNPITVVFTLPEDQIPQVAQEINAGKTLTVEAYGRNQNTLLATGKLLTVDNQIDPTTGTVKLKAIFQNENNALFPNQFVNIKLLVKRLPNATVIPTAGIQRGVDATFVYLFNADFTVNVKPVTVGIDYGEDTVVNSGLLPGQSVVVEGVDKLTDGAAVKLEEDNKENPTDKNKMKYRINGAAK